MMYSSSCNITKTDSYIRIAIAAPALIYGIYSISWVFIIFAVVLFYSALSRFCIIYKLLQINKKFSSDYYYKSMLPQYNPAAVFIFDADGKLLFKNQAAQKELDNIKSIEDFDILFFENIVSKDLEKSFIYENDHKTYQISLKGLSKDNLILTYANDVSKVAQLHKDIEKTQREIIYTMGEISETRSRETGYHVKRVAEYSKLLALKYGLSKQEANILKMASPMHDIGKISIPDKILNKPGPHKDEEAKIMKTHTTLGYKMLKKSNKPILKAAAIVAHQHHEKWDGTGYPKGLLGEQIHIYGRITAVADVFDALGSDSVYKKAWQQDAILRFFNKQKGKHFDPKLIDLFMENLDEFLTIRNTYIDEAK